MNSPFWVTRRPPLGSICYVKFRTGLSGFKAYLPNIHRDFSSQTFKKAIVWPRPRWCCPTFW